MLSPVREGQLFLVAVLFSISPGGVSGSGFTPPLACQCGLQVASHLFGGLCP